MKQLRPVISLGLIMVLAFNILGYCFFSVLLIAHKKSTFHKILQGKYGTEESVIFVATNLSNAKWEHDHEFELNGEMYDVVKEELKNGELIYTCKKDNWEDKLKKQQRKTKEKEVASHMVKFHKIFTQTFSPLVIECHLFGDFISPVYMHICRTGSIYTDIEYPPKI